MSNNTSHAEYLPKVSVIIPVYNTGNYLRQGLDSICNQTLRELEIIIVNDGSTDNSPCIIEEYAQKDFRIQWRTQPNQGQAVARNNGLLLATGKYIYFMDSDDILDTEALQKCYEMCEQNNLDIVTFDAETILEDCITTDSYKYSRKNIVNESKVWTGPELLEYELKHNVFFVVPWLFFTNHKFLKKNFSGFPSGIIHEDHAFAVQIMLYAKRVYYISHPYFKRRVRASSTMTHHFSMRNIEGYTTVFTQMDSWVRQHDEWQKIIKLYLFRTLNTVVWLGHRMTFLEKIETYCRLRRLKFSPYVTLKNWMVFWFKKS